MRILSSLVTSRLILFFKAALTSNNPTPVQAHNDPPSRERRLTKDKIYQKDILQCSPWTQRGPTMLLLIFDMFLKWATSYFLKEMAAVRRRQLPGFKVHCEVKATDLYHLSAHHLWLWVAPLLPLRVALWDNTLHKHHMPKKSPIFCMHVCFEYI